LLCDVKQESLANTKVRISTEQQKRRNLRQINTRNITLTWKVHSVVIKMKA